jgi:alpha-N-arabinofuranosidase
MPKSTLNLHSEFHLGPVDPRIFGGFMEHMGRCVYQGVFEPGNPLSDAAGFRLDVLAALKAQNYSVMRYPGGNFASAYHWMDGVGPREKRPRMRDLAWQSIESNAFGTEEYMELVRRMNWTPMLTVNLGTGTPEEARNWVEYCNMPAGTRYADMRPGAAHGVKLWCLGNEMDGPWQLGHVPARDYAIRAQQAAKMMKDCDKTLELVACGTCYVGLPSYIEWDREVLEYLGDQADYISLHRYSNNRDDDTAAFLAEGIRIDAQIEQMDSVCRFVQAKRRSKKRAFLCFDEWNVWYKDMGMDGAGKEAPRLIEEVYNLEDALVVASYLISFIRHADVLKVANLAQIVNVIAPILAEKDHLVLQSIYHAFNMVSSRRAGVALQARLSGPTYEVKELPPVPMIDTIATLDGKKLTVFAVNRDQHEKQMLEIKLADGSIARFLDGELLSGPGAKTANSREKQAIAPRALTGCAIQDGTAQIELPPLSFAAFSLQLA